MVEHGRLSMRDADRPVNGIPDLKHASPPGIAV